MTDDKQTKPSGKAEGVKDEYVPPTDVQAKPMTCIVTHTINKKDGTVRRYPAWFGADDTKAIEAAINEALDTGRRVFELRTHEIYERRTVRRGLLGDSG